MLAKSKEMEPSRYERQMPSTATKPAVKKIPKEPVPLDFLLDVPSISALDYNVLKLTAKYVARNGRQFLLNLSQREMRNPQFDFLRPNHSLHGLFLRLVEQYSRVLMPSKALLEKLHMYGKEKYQILGLILQRVEYTRYIREQHMQEEEIAERERLAFSAIDWHDFVIAETIDFGPSDRNIELPKPLEYSEITRLSLVQRRELWNGNTMAGLATASHEEPEEEEMDVEAAAPVLAQASTAPPAKRVAAASTGSVKIREDYVPKAHAKATPLTEATEICPLCSQSVPTSQIAEHMRIEALDPKWKEQKDRHLAKHQESNYVISGTEVSQNLQVMTKVRSESEKDTGPANRRSTRK
jgi:splicing factor 3A subunit 1